MIRTTEALRTRLAEARADAQADGAAPRVALVSTIGSLHDGHIDLIHTAREIADIVVVSIFVNPLRFRTPAEFEAYPRTPDDDLALLDSLGVDIVFAPDTAELLPDGSATTKVTAGDLGLRYEGRMRPFYFDGLLTVEAKLLHLVAPDVAVYGLRDRQRVFLVKRMIRDLFFDVAVETVETVRGDDGLPVSTRVGMLEPRDLAAAAKLPAALEAAASNADRGVDACIAAAQSSLMGEPRITLEYLSVVDPVTFLPVDEGHGGPAVALIAASVAGHRFIDNAEIYLR
ncbi:pantoate--beta-alanine ligase [Microbacterium terricola]|uniref:Pantothenate synthetase n=1 Tax=Microbacterium terricola TaxID=344163 RepID=A0ABM8DV89_9MICO|nr:pantoate--beta-alanine ligase [Microbacterium terricola]UYK39703.1 pantoate--beta-alanine ligase [Microbacterium terricola]BDV29553.1 pantothenate synthetase [Microbacterium terricola]